MKEYPPSNLKVIVLVSAVLAVVIVGAVSLWTTIFLPIATMEVNRVGWYLFSFISGISMIVLPGTLPLTLVIISLSLGRGFGRGVGMALSFGLGISVMLSMYGVLAAVLGEAGLRVAGAEVADIKNWVYFIAGFFAYVFALSEIGLVKFYFPAYVGYVPKFVHKKKFIMTAFLLGLLFGNVGVGSSHPAVPLLLIESLSSGDVFYGWSLFFVHALGRVLPLLFLSGLAMLGVNGLTWLLAKRETIVKGSGWGMSVVASLILTVGVFAGDWWAKSTLYDVGLFGQPVLWGWAFLAFLWILPLWWHYAKEQSRVYGTPAMQIQKLQRTLERTEEERMGLEGVLHLNQGVIGKRIKELEFHIDGLWKKRMVLEEAMRYGARGDFRDSASQGYEEQLLRLRLYLYLVMTAFLVLVFALFSSGTLVM